MQIGKRKCVITSFLHYSSLLPPFCHSVIPSFCHSAIPSFRHSVILSFCHSVILSFCHSVIPSFCHSVIPSFLIPSFRHSVILSFRHFVIPPLFCHFSVIVPPRCASDSLDYYVFLRRLQTPSFLGFQQHSKVIIA